MSDEPGEGQATDMNVSRVMQQAFERHQQSSLADAEALYRQAREVAPQQPDALHFLGILCHQTGRQEEALGLMQQARVVTPD
ncbi:MAG: tetratricopeptide repeat protein, partial [Gammaproteobacteria bacterium]